MNKLFHLLPLLLGLLLFIYGTCLLIDHYAPHQIFPIEEVVNVPFDDTPVRLTIPKLALDLPIVTEPVSSRGVSYEPSTPRPGNIGNTVMYGHNYRRLLGTLNQLKPGDLIDISSGDGRTFTYRVHFITLVDPRDTALTASTLDSRLTLYTCAGFLDSKRLVVTALLD